MKKMICGAVLGVGVAVALFAMPSAATAKAGTFVVGPSRTEGLQLKGSNGYSISVSGEGRGQVSLTAKHGGSSATYITRGIASATRLKGRFGNLGRISMRFRSDGHPRRVPVASKRCQGKGKVVDRGHWVGKLEFEGEQGYVTVRASGAKGMVTRGFQETCKRPKGESGHSSPFKVTFLAAASRTPAVLVTALEITSKTESEFPGFTSFDASIMERLGSSLAVIRTIAASAKSDVFTSIVKEGRIESVTIAPPAPFTGTATFQRTTGSKGSWTGSLVGDFLGRGEVTLAGPEFSAEVETG